MRKEDEELITRFLVGERAAMDEIEGWVARAAWPFQRRLAAHWEDVLQEARTELARLLRAGKFRGEASLKTYLSRVVSYLCINHLRAQTKWRWTDLDDLPSSLDTSEDSPLAALLRREADQLLLRVLERMPEECRALWGMILDGLSYHEMSERMNTAEGALRVRALRCRQKAAALREELARQKSDVPL